MDGGAEFRGHPKSVNPSYSPAGLLRLPDALTPARSAMERPAPKSLESDSSSCAPGWRVRSRKCSSARLDHMEPRVVRDGACR